MMRKEEVPLPNHFYFECTLHRRMMCYSFIQLYLGLIVRLSTAKIQCMFAIQESNKSGCDEGKHSEPEAAQQRWQFLWEQEYQNLLLVNEGVVSKWKEALYWSALGSLLTFCKTRTKEKWRGVSKDWHAEFGTQVNSSWGFIIPCLQILQAYTL